MSMHDTPRYTKLATPATFSKKRSGNADFCHHAVTVTPKIKLRNNKKYNF
jgi:hypothetical protein